MTEDRRTVAVKSHGHVVVATFYKISDELKQARIETKVRWSEHEFEKEFTESAERFESEQPGATKGAARPSGLQHFTESSARIFSYQIQIDTAALSLFYQSCRFQFIFYPSL
ncbi:hypothetical protein HO173_010082 [Letharia columbiana]|uniref:Uncharacterized protein n=1 Tax=Letharia columbiana TaxID=112416 RepID=A0A8H6L177_9LECA|nr:uncharacterized protein HO173_010082 [Letharia columbiana]KAF6231780.1 hypothetical protein HO173_010082 [Letharia columbiana]